ncbi:putative toxin-antitoxin system toxin component, PIN family [Candidatus Wirthbacteria bacterium CG2_30_54_11]|uniref:Putative toxin-antitoxin system toxin component, PIN family n=1 Tax=Candidatus Wirthbacteria bacterium CG2_30_54_11 TaxID=1817892 RepID=A0A1J5J3M7_9BACT|nr:MAG: putative toxin-antitoxin system toxin component, PIN family [Candidatus Wirthbacteria bacterium CG2_30_54_11]
MTITLDTNVFISVLLGSRGGPAEIMAFWWAGSFDLAVSPPLLEEIVAVAFSERLASLIRPDEVLALVQILEKKAFWVDGTQAGFDRDLRDPDDRMVVQSALESGSSYLVTGNLKHLKAADGVGGIRVVSPREFIGCLSKAR